MSSRSTASFRDPSGFVYFQDGEPYRQVNPIYSDNYKQLNSGLLKELWGEGLLIPHQEISSAADGSVVIKPEKINFISYPYEWCFGQLKAAALLTLDIAIRAVAHNMILKDATAYNVQFIAGRPVFIDTLSFEKYVEGSPWPAYRQFCQHFLAPLLLFRKDPRLSQLSRNFIDGIPLDLASGLLPFSSRFSLSTQMHVHLHARAQKKYSVSAAAPNVKSVRINRNGLLGLLHNLKSFVGSLSWDLPDTEWGDYYSDTNYSDTSFQYKKTIVEAFLREIPDRQLAADVGGNTGVFSRVIAEHSGYVISADIDPVAVEKNYQQTLVDKKNILPLIIDLTNPSPAIGWNNSERDSFLKRHKPGFVMALALIHHLAISNNLPLADIAACFSGVSPYLIIEFVPKEDSQVQKLLKTRVDIFPDYNVRGFEEAFGRYYQIVSKRIIPGSERVLYLLKTK